jgi:hypothetical protein
MRFLSKAGLYLQVSLTQRMEELNRCESVGSYKATMIIAIISRELNEFEWIQMHIL